MKIYTKTGDDGITGLQGGQRVSKTNPRIMAYGNVDEINAILGIILAHDLEKENEELLTQIQNDLFLVGADLSNPDLSISQNRVSIEMIKFLEEKIDETENQLSPLTNFILPGGTTISSYLHLARAITRRAEIRIVDLTKNEKINDNCGVYLNRLSDLFFVLARLVNKRSGKKDIIWKSKKDTL